MEKSDRADTTTVIVDWTIDIFPKGPVAAITWAYLGPDKAQVRSLEPPHVWTVVMLQRFQKLLPELIRTLQDSGGRGIQ